MNFFHFLRVNRGLTQRAIAQKMHVHPAMISKLEQGWFARCSEDMELKLQETFGKEWTFKRLMQPVPNVAANDSDAA